mmetsp:Transcript_27678/g.89060  ORF Transcript_27678/g.89060 Transcript_27678/m.89060 type:complete len:244 (+) Transcript_27678:2058-2789(+)
MRSIPRCALAGASSRSAAGVRFRARRSGSGAVSTTQSPHRSMQRSAASASSVQRAACDATASCSDCECARASRASASSAKAASNTDMTPASAVACMTASRGAVSRPTPLLSLRECITGTTVLTSCASARHPPVSDASRCSCISTLATARLRAWRLLALAAPSSSTSTAQLRASAANVATLSTDAMRAATSLASWSAPPYAMATSLRETASRICLSACSACVCALVHISLVCPFHGRRQMKQNS